MAQSETVSLQVQLDDPSLNAAALEQLTQSLQPQLQKIVGQVERVPKNRSGDGELVKKGDEKEPGLLQMEINLESIQKAVSWIYQRVAGRPTRVKLKLPEGIEFEFEGNNVKDAQTIMQEVSALTEKLSQR